MVWVKKEEKKKKRKELAERGRVIWGGCEPWGEMGLQF